jgi:prostaglandin reductase 1
LKKGDILYQSEFISVDPYMRIYTKDMTPPYKMIGQQVAKVVESKDPDFPVGTRILAHVGWAEKGIINDKKKARVQKAPTDLGGMSPSHLLGACGMPGNTAYFGLLDICSAKKGEVVLVNGAAGAVGSIVGQIAKIKGCKVIGYAGTEDKVKWLKEELKFDYVFNYKTTKIEDTLDEAAPGGVDCFFDNVGGHDANVVISRMKHRGRIAICGAISSYNVKDLVWSAPALQPLLLGKELRIEGFIVSRFQDRWMEGINQLVEWVKEGKLVIRDTVVDGFEKVPEAFMSLLQGGNTGKMVVKV